MDSKEPKVDGRKRPGAPWLVPFFCLELAIAIGALFGVLLLNPDWIGGLGMGNLVWAIVLGLVPSFAVATAISRQQRVSRSAWTGVLCFAALAASTYSSYSFGVAMVGI